MATRGRINKPLAILIVLFYAVLFGVHISRQVHKQRSAWRRRQQQSHVRWLRRP